MIIWISIHILIFKYNKIKVKTKINLIKSERDQIMNDSKSFYCVYYYSYSNAVDDNLLVIDCTE